MARVNFTGRLNGGEVFSTGFWINQVDVSSDEDAAELAGTIRDLAHETGAVDLFAQLKTWINTGSAYERVVVYGYPTGGPVASHVGDAAIATADGVGTGSTQLPNELAACITLRTGFAGRRRRGRMYMPANTFGKYATVTGTTEARWESTTVTALVSAWGALFNQINLLAGPFADGHVAVLSAIEGVSKAVTEITMDDQPDIQRRRANRLRGTILAATVVAP